MVVLDPDVAKAFNTPEAVNTALRAIAEQDQNTQEDLIDCDLGQRRF